MSPAQSVLTTPYQAGGSKTIVDEPLRPQGFRHTLYNLIHSRITSQGWHNLALTQHTHKACASLWMSNLTLVWLGYDLLSVSHSSALPHIQQPQIGEWRGINSPRHQTSRWLKAAESSTIGWSDAMLFRASVHPMLLPVALHCTWVVSWCI
jgi:hypothetical protein